MACNDALLLRPAYIVLIGHAATHHVILLIKFVDPVEGILIDAGEKVAWSTAKVPNGLILESASDPIVASVQFGPHLLE